MAKTTIVGVVAELLLDGKRFLGVDEVSYGVSRNTDERGSPTDAPKAALLRVAVRASADDEVSMLYDWAFKMDKQLSGSIEFSQHGASGNVIRKVEFTDAYCVGFRETFQPDDSTPRGFGAFVVPNTKDYKPVYRGRLYWDASKNGKVYELVLAPSKVKIGTIEISN